MADLPRHPTLAELEAAAEAWGCNCGPAALCAVTGLTPDEVRPAFGSDWPGYTNPTWMGAALRALGWRYVEVLRADVWREPPPQAPAPLALRLTRVQWGGPWTRPGVPMRARYRQTHWIAEATAPSGPGVWDVNVGRWIRREAWVAQVVPIILEACVARADGTWWRTHVWEVARG